MRDALNVPCLVTKMTPDSGAATQSGAAKQELCAVVKLAAESGVQPLEAEDSSSPGAAQDVRPDAVLLLPINTTATINDTLEVEGMKLKVISMEDVRDVVGKLDHFRIEAIAVT